MGRFISNFDTTAEFATFSATTAYSEPHVTLLKDNNEVRFIEPPMIDGHRYVDLGLPSGTKWATMNVGASSETDYGNYYQYGKGSAQYTATSGQSDYSGTENPLAASADTAVQVWGGSWHMPTQAQLTELMANTNLEYVENFNDSGVNGIKYTATNGKYLFFPAAGSYNNGTLSGLGVNFGTWSSTPYAVAGRAYQMYYSSPSFKGVGSASYYFGEPIRPVSD